MSMTAYESRLAIYAAIERSSKAVDAQGQPFFPPADAWQIRCAPEDFNALSEAAGVGLICLNVDKGFVRLVFLPDPAFPPGVVMATPVDLESVTAERKEPWKL